MKKLIFLAVICIGFISCFTTPRAEAKLTLDYKNVNFHMSEDMKPMQITAKKISFFIPSPPFPNYTILEIKVKEQVEASWFICILHDIARYTCIYEYLRLFISIYTSLHHTNIPY